MDRAIFFDVDGTLFDTRRDLAATVNHTRRDLGLAEWPVQAIIENVGQGARYLLAHSIPDTTKSFDDLWPIFKSHYAEHCCETLTLYPGVIETLAELKARGWKMGVNTNKPRFAVEAILKKFNLTDLFGAAVVAGGDGIPLKPDPESLRVCAAKMNHTLSSADWMVGDSWTDLECARAAGVRSAFCPFGFGRLRDSVPTARLETFSSLISLVG